MKFGKIVFYSSVFLLAAGFAVRGNAQSKDFKSAKSLEIQYNILKELSSNFVDTIDMEKLLSTGIDAMLSSLDPYTEYLPEEDEEAIEMMTTATYGGIGSVIKKVDSVGVIISQPYVGSPAVKYGLEPGDVILKIDSTDVSTLTADESSNRMKGQPGTEVVFLVRKARTGKTEEIKVIRERIHISDVSYAGMVNDTVGYIKIDAFTVGGAKDVRNAFLDLKAKGAERMILDLRGNGGGLMEEAVNIVSLFVPQGTEAVSAKGRDPESTFSYKTVEEPVDTLMPLMVLVNSGSASSSEIVAGALQDLDRAVIMGTRTFGKGLVQSIRPMGYNSKMKFTTAKYYTPSGRCVQAIDYTRRNADGSAGNVPDSLKKEFKTKGGRSVYDGGGIAPDVEIASEVFSRPVVSLAVNDIMNDYALLYYASHPRIASPADFRLSDYEYADFVDYASGRNFDSRSAAQVQIDQMIRSAKEEGLYERSKGQFDALTESLNLSKAQILNMKREEIQPLVEEEIVSKYYLIPGKVEAIVRTDKQLQKAVEKWKDFSFTGASEPVHSNK